MTEIELLGSSLQRVARQTFVGVLATKLDDRTLQERTRTVLPSTTDEPASLHVSGDRVVVLRSGAFHVFDLELRNGRATPASDLGGGWDWLPAKAIGPDYASAGSRVSSSCTPRWTFGHEVYACRSPMQVELIRVDPATP